MTKKSAGKVLLQGVLGIIVFLIFVGILNLINRGIANPIYDGIVDFFNINLLFLLMISVIMLLGDVFETFIFPINILYPFFNAIGGVLWAILAYRILMVADFYSGFDFYPILEPFYFIILIVFLVILIVGLVKVFLKLGKVEKRGLKHKDVHHDWGDVGDEFKEAAYNLAVKVKDGLEPDIKKNKGMKKTKKHGKRKRKE